MWAVLAAQHGAQRQPARYCGEARGHPRPLVNEVRCRDGFDDEPSNSLPAMVLSALQAAERPQLLLFAVVHG